MTLRAILFFLLLVSGPLLAQSDSSFEAKVIAVKDGDTIEIIYDSFTTRVRLSHIDCPEKGQPFGKAAKTYTSDLCFGRIVRVQAQAKPDRYGRLLAEVFVGDSCINKALVRAGMAWHYLQYSKDTSYSSLETKAHQQQAGLWTESDPIAPWLWRKGIR